MEVKEFFGPAQPEQVWAQIKDVRLETYGERQVIVVELRVLAEEVSRLLFFNASNAKSSRSKWQRWLRALNAVGIPTDSPEGVIGKFVRFSVVENTANFGGQEQLWEFWKPEVVFPDESAALMDMVQPEEAILSDIPDPLGDVRESTDIPADVLQLAKQTWAAVGHSVDTFRAIATNTWPNVDFGKLLKAVQS